MKENRKRTLGHSVKYLKVVWSGVRGGVRRRGGPLILI